VSKGKKNNKSVFFENLLAQATIEYLIIIGVIVIISLAVVSLVVTQTDSTGSISSSGTRLSNASEEVSLTELIIDDTENALLTIKNNSRARFYVTGINIGGTVSNYNELMRVGEKKVFSLDTNGSSCSCANTTSNTKQCDIDVNTLSVYGLTHVHYLSLIGNCTQEASPVDLNGVVQPIAAAFFSTDFTYDPDLSELVEIVDGNYVMTDSNSQLVSVIDLQLVDIIANDIFSYTGADQTFTVPAGITSIDVKLWGGGGGGGAIGGWSYGFPGGAGGYAGGTLAVTPDQNITIMVGAGGNSGTVPNSSPNYGGGARNCNTGSDCRYGGQGGGRSEVIVGETNFIIAGGGGGGGSSRASTGQFGGAGGGSYARDGTSYTAACKGLGATYLVPGGATSGCANAQGEAGTQYFGGNPASNAYGGSGGGGYFGGGGGGYGEPNDMGGGGGGSSNVIGPSITTVGDYTIQTFTNSGNFIVPSGSTNVEVLIVGGGGSGGGRHGGGGGGGGVLHLTDVPVSTGSYSIVVGAGGPAVGGTSIDGVNGEDSSAFGETAKGGGRGGSYCSGTVDLNGGSGGGAGHQDCGNTAGVATQGQPVSHTGTGYGNNGGASPTGSNEGSGGGGAGAVGENSIGDVYGGAGGNGILINITGEDYYWAGGGGGGGWTEPAGNGGLGGGGGGGGANGGAAGTGGGSALNSGATGSNTTACNGGAGGANTGGGGGGSGQWCDCGWYGYSGAGGSGVVIIKYLTNSIPTNNYNESLTGWTNLSTIAGNGIIPGNSSDTNRGTAGNGGAIDTVGNSGRVVISYPDQEIVTYLETGTPDSGIDISEGYIALGGNE